MTGKPKDHGKKKNEQVQVVSPGIAPRVLQPPRAPQLYLSTLGLYKNLGDNFIYIVDGIIHMPPSTRAFDQ